MATIRGEVNKDIATCEEILQENNVEKAKKHIELIVHSYENFIDNITNGLSTYTSYYDSDHLADITLLKKKLEMFKANECEPIRKITATSAKGNINIVNKNESLNKNQNFNSNTNYIELEFKQMISQIRDEVENSEILSHEDIEDILEKLSKIEEVQESSDNKNKKWFNLRDILSWMSTKGVDIGLKLMPLILKSLENQ